MVRHLLLRLHADTRGLDLRRQSILDSFLPSHTYLPFLSYLPYTDTPTEPPFEPLDTSPTSTMSASDIFLGLIAILFPPIAVWIKRGLCSADSLINILLCVLGYVPGLLHAWYIIAAYPEIDHDYEPVDPEGGRVTYVVVGQGPNRNYGTAGQGQQGRQAKPASNIPPSVAAHSRPPPQAPQAGNGESSSGDAPPPTYQDAVKGDHRFSVKNKMTNLWNGAVL